MTLERSAVLAFVLVTVGGDAFAQPRGAGAPDRDIPPWAWRGEGEERGAVASQSREGNIFGEMVRDLGAVFTTPVNLRIAAGGLGASGVAALLDDEVEASGFSSELRDGGLLDHVFEPADLLGSALVQIAGPTVLYGLGRWTDQQELVEVSRQLLRAQLVTQGLTQAVKWTTSRTRPDGEGNNAFPSGHTSATFATATVLHRRYGWKAGGVAYIFASWVAVSRLNEQRHWLSDLPFGAALGVLVGRTVTRDRRAPPLVAPLVVPGGAGVVLTLRSPRR